MKIRFLAVGKNHDAALKAAIDDFTKRITNYFPVEWQLIPPQKNAGQLNEKELQAKEAQAILQAVKKDDYLVALEETGKQLSSEELANLLQARANESTKQIVFLIGGAYGLDQPVLQRADYRWSLSRLIFPHQLVRLILAEQVYRACTILRNEKYHHS